MLDEDLQFKLIDFRREERRREDFIRQNEQIRDETRLKNI